MRPLPLSILLGAVLAGAPAAQSPAADSDLGMFWQSDLAAAREQAAKEQRPLLLLFRCER